MEPQCISNIKARLNREKNRNICLFEITASAIADDFTNYLDINRQNLANLPQAIRVKLLEKLEDRWGEIVSDIRSHLRVFELLLSDLTRSVTLKGIISLRGMGVPGSTACHRWILNRIAYYAPNITTLVLSTKRSYVNMEQQMLDAICKLKNLKALLIGPCHTSITDLKKICRNLKALRSLYVASVNFDLFRPDDEDERTEIVECFSHLRSLCFETVNLDHSEFVGAMKVRFLRLCIRLLPQLETLGTVVANPSHFLTRLTLFAQDLPNQPSHLQNLRICPSTLQISQTFLHLRLLQVICPDNWELNPAEINPLLELTSDLVELELINIPSLSATLVTSFLERYGKNLLVLKIWNINGAILKLQLQTLLGKCPKLEVLSLVCVVLTDCERQLRSYAKLQDFLWFVKDRDQDEVRLCNILAAPMLKRFRVSIPSSKLVCEDLRLLSTRVAQRRILGELTYFAFNVRPKPIGLRQLTEIIHFIETASAYTPNLKAFFFQFLVRNDLSPAFREAFPSPPHLATYLYAYDKQDLLHYIKAFRLRTSSAYENSDNGNFLVYSIGIDEDLRLIRTQ